MTKSQKNEKKRKAVVATKSTAKTYLVISALLVFILPIVLSMAVQQITMSNYLKTSSSSTSKAQLENISGIVHDTLTEINNIVKKMASDPFLHASIDNPNKRHEIEHYFSQSNPKIKRVLIIPKNSILKRTDITPPIDFSQLDTLRKLEKNSGASITYSGKKNKAEIRVGHTITRPDQTTLGTILVNFETTILTTSWSQLIKPGDYFELKHKVADAQNKFLSWFIEGPRKTTEAIETDIVSINNTTWTLQFASAQDAATRNRSLQLPIALGSILGLINAILLLTLWKSFGKETQRNLHRFVAQFQTKPNSDTADLYTIPAFSAAHRSLQSRFQALSERATNSTTNTPPNPDSQNAKKERIHSQLNKSVSNQNSELLDMNLDLEDDIDFETPEARSMSQPDTHSNKNIPSSIFRQYDIRGIVGETLSEELMILLGKAIASFAISKGESSIVVGRDGRLSSKSLSKALANGIISTGCNVKDIGEVPTPVVYYGTFELQTRSGIMITGSHNPPNYNGLKIVIAGETLHGETITYLKNLVEVGHFETGKGIHTTINLNQRYIYRISNDVSLTRSLKVVVDAGNGVAGPMVLDLLGVLGCQVEGLYCDVDGNFPNHHPDPSKPENLKDLIAKVKETKADIGLAFDGDGDRLGVVTPKGKVIFSDRLLMLYVRDILMRNPGGEVIFDIKCTNDLNEIITSLGGTPIMWKTGHSLIKAKLKETGALIAGEMSGHIFFNDRWYGFDDALYSAARLLELLTMDSRSADDIFAELPEKISTPEINIAVTEETKFKIIEELTTSGSFGGNIITIDGVRVDYPNRWGLVRASNTTPNLVARFEGDSAENLALIKREFKQNLRQIDSEIDLSF